MSIISADLLYDGNNILFLEKVLIELKKKGKLTEEVLYRASEVEKLERILQFGTDRGGYPEKKLWGYSKEIGREILHEDVIFATTEEDIRKGEIDKTYTTSFKKFLIIENPLLLVYNAQCFMKLKEKQYVFVNPYKKLNSILAVFSVIKIPENLDQK